MSDRPSIVECRLAFTHRNELDDHGVCTVCGQSGGLARFRMVHEISGSGRFVVSGGIAAPGAGNWAIVPPRTIPQRPSYESDPNHIEPE